MGNCQAAEAAAAVIEHPDGRVERAYWPLPASHVMASNPGYYVAHLIVTNTNSNSSAATVKHLKLLRPSDAILVGHVYRLVSFQDVLKEFGSKKHVRLSRLLHGNEKDERSAADVQKKKKKKREIARRGAEVNGGGGGNERPRREISQSMMKEEEQQEEETEVLGFGNRGGILGSNTSIGLVSGKHFQWRPTLESIAEVGGQT